MGVVSYVMSLRLILKITWDVAWKQISLLAPVVSKAENVIKAKPGGRAIMRLRVQKSPHPGEEPISDLSALRLDRNTAENLQTRAQKILDHKSSGNGGSWVDQTEGSRLWRRYWERHIAVREREREGLEPISLTPIMWILMDVRGEK